MESFLLALLVTMLKIDKKAEIALLKIRRIPIALRLFLTVLLTTLLITTVSLGVLHVNMQRKFQPNMWLMSKCKSWIMLIENLADVYAVLSRLGQCRFKAQILPD